MDTNPRRGRGRGPQGRGFTGSTTPGQPQVPRPQQQFVARPQQQTVARPQQQTVARPQQQTVARPQQQTAARPPSRQPAQASTSQVEQLIPQIQRLAAGNPPVSLGRGVVRGRREMPNPKYIVPRPLSSMATKAGTIGTKIELKSNYFPITSYTKWNLYQYRVDCNPEEERIGVKKALLHVHDKLLSPYIFDGTMLFSTKKYDSKKLELTSKRFDDKIMIITIAYTNIVETGDYAYMQVFNLILRNCMRHLKLCQIKRNFYDPIAKINIDNYNLQIWPGYETTIGMFDNGLLLRADISTKIMRQDTVFNFLQECFKSGGQDWMSKFKSGIIGTVVLTKYNNKTYRIDDVDDTVNINSTFKKKDGTSISYFDYFKQKYQIEARGGNQPMLLSKKKKSINDSADQEELLYLVPEFCVMTGLTDAMRNNFALMKELSQHTQVNPKERIKRYNNFMKRLQTTPDSLNEFKPWNMKLGSELINVTGRVLDTEKIRGHLAETYDGGFKADWTNHIRRLPMFVCSLMQQWVVFCPRTLESSIHRFIECIQKVAGGMSFSLPRPEIIIIGNTTAQSFSAELEKYINYKNPAFILCVVPSQRQDVYNVIKRKLCVDRAVPSQVVVSKNVTKPNPMSICTKIAIQINCKLGGTPWYIGTPSKMMLVGFDVCHDKQNKNVSYGAFVATLNSQCSKYFSCVQPHKSGEELSNQFSLHIIKAIQKYREHNKNELPNSIIIYRDGVGDGQVSQVHQVEVAGIKPACKEAFGVEIPFAFVIVKKRISTRFFVPKRGSDEFTNPPPGTVIDSVVTDPSMYDFYLVSQNTNFGTVTPTHYHIIEDTLPNWSPDRMQKLTYRLTHMYYNWSGTIRVPSMCQLAHKLAFFTAQTLRTTPNSGLDELLYFL